MLKFFRHIRQQLLDQNEMKKYTLFAIGEITLVVIGILIALQINNWNEERKDREKENYFLKNIKSDLEQDVIELDQLIQIQCKRLSIFKKLDPDFHLDEKLKIPLDNPKFNFKRLFDRGRSYRPVKGSYTSLISDGQSHLITNRNLLSKIQEIYDVEYSHIASLYETLKEVETSLKKKRAYEIKYPPYNTWDEITDKMLLADLSYLYDVKYHYTSILMNQRERIKKVIQLIDEKLNNQNL